MPFRDMQQRPLKLSNYAGDEDRQRYAYNLKPLGIAEKVRPNMRLIIPRLLQYTLKVDKEEGADALYVHELVEIWGALKADN
jgi:hypothetical protein